MNPPLSVLSCVKSLPQISHLTSLSSISIISMSLAPLNEFVLLCDNIITGFLLVKSGQIYNNITHRRKPMADTPVTPEIADLQAKLSEAISTRDSAKSKLREYEAKVQEYESQQVKRRAEEEEHKKKQELDQSVQRGEYEKALALTKSKYEDQISKMRSNFTSKYLPTMIQTLATKIDKLSPQAINDLPSLVSTRIQLDDEFRPVVVGDDGKPLVDKELKPVSPESYLQSFVAERPYLLVDALPPGGGKTGQSLRKPSVELDKGQLAELAEKDPSAYRAHLKERYSPQAIMGRIKVKQK